jgi:hypothetical protein
MAEANLVEQRISVQQPGQLQGPDGTIECEILTLSRQGAQLRGEGDLGEHSEFDHSIRDFGQLACRVVEFDDGIAELRFEGDPETQDSVFQEIVAQLADAEGRRHFLRRSVLWPGTLKTLKGQHPCTVLNMSLTGAKIALSEARDCMGNVTLLGDRFEGLDATVVWQRGRLVGLQFRVAPAEVAAILGDLLPAIKASA